MKLINITSAVLAILLLAGCSANTKQIESHKLTTDIAGLVPDDSVRPAILFKRPNAASLSTYDSFIVDSVKISHRDPNNQKINPADLLRMQNYFQKQVTTQLSDAGYKITDQAGPKTMRITFTLSGISTPSAKANVVSMIIPIALKVGEVTVEAAFTESQSNRVDAVVVSSSQGSRVLNESPWSTWGDLESSFDNWAQGIAKAVNKSHASAN